MHSPSPALVNKINTPITAAQVKAERDKRAIKDKDGKVIRKTPGLICISTGPNRQQRRAAAVAKTREEHNDRRVVRNNRKTCGEHVFRKMSYFHISTDLQRRGIKTLPAAA